MAQDLHQPTQLNVIIVFYMSEASNEDKKP